MHSRLQKIILGMTILFLPLVANAEAANDNVPGVRVLFEDARGVGKSDALKVQKIVKSVDRNSKILIETKLTKEGKIQYVIDECKALACFHRGEATRLFNEAGNHPDAFLAVQGPEDTRSPGKYISDMKASLTRKANLHLDMAAENAAMALQVRGMAKPPQLPFTYGRDLRHIEATTQEEALQRMTDAQYLGGEVTSIKTLEKSAEEIAEESLTRSGPRALLKGLTAPEMIFSEASIVFIGWASSASAATIETARAAPKADRHAPTKTSAAASTAPADATPAPNGASQ